MDLEMEDLVFQWPAPFCSLIADMSIPDHCIIDGMLADIELPQMPVDDTVLEPVAGDGDGDGAGHGDIADLRPDKRFPNPPWPCGDLRIPRPTTPATAMFTTNSSSILLPGFGAAESPPSFAHAAGSHEEARPFTSPAAKPRRSRAPSKAGAKKSAKAKNPPPESTSSAAAAAAPPVTENPRLATQVEHIIRERQRRDDMAAKYLILESLLPPAAKRERSVVVEDAMVFVKDLQHRRNELLKRRDQLKVQHYAGQSPRPRHIVQGKLRDSSRVVPASVKQLAAAKNCATDSTLSSSMLTAGRDLITPPSPPAFMQQTGERQDRLGSSCGRDEKPLQIHVHFAEEEVVIEMMCCQPRPNFQSFLLQAVESFALDVTRCSIHRLPHGFVQCTITSKLQLAPSPRPELQSSATLIGVLRDVLIHK